MTPDQYRAAIATLGLSQQAAGRWLGVSPKTAQNYAKLGPSGPAAVAIRMALEHGLGEQWRPIETAVKDELGQVLLYDLDIGVCTGYWSSAYGWQVSDGTSVMEGDVTHWMPYPHPPKDVA